MSENNEIEKIKELISFTCYKLEKTDNHLNKVTKSNLLLCLLSFVTLYYPNAKIFDTSISIKNTILPISIMFLLGINFAMWGYYLWRFYKQRMILNKYIKIYYEKSSNINIDDVLEIYKNESVFELLYKLESKNQFLGIVFASLILSLNHTVIILNFLYFSGNSTFGSIIILVLVSLIFILCYSFYYKQMKKLYGKNWVKEDEYKIVRYITLFILIFTVILTSALWIFNKPSCFYF